MSRLIVITLALLAGTFAFAQEAVPGHLLVRFTEPTAIEAWLDKWNSRADQPDLVLGRSLGQRQLTYLLHAPAAQRDYLLAELNKRRDVQAVQSDYRVQMRDLIPDDNLFGDQVNLEIIQAPDVWEITTGGQTLQGDDVVLVALDLGFQPMHPDLVENVWRNTAEIPNDNIDNDGNGYIDDVIGWNFSAQSNEHAAINHGQKVAGIMGARGNNGQGITGINWETRLMLLSFDGLVSQIIEALEYTLDMRTRYNASNGTEGAFVVAVNESFGIDRQFCSQQPIWGALHDDLGDAGILPVVAVENDNYDVDILGDMPGTCPSPYQITVTNTTQEDRFFDIAAFGAESVDLGAPGQNALSLSASSGYSPFVGTSSATPHVTGAVGLLYTLPTEFLAADALTQPAATALFVRQAILDGVDLLDDLADKTVTGGRLNLFNSMVNIQTTLGNEPAPLNILRVGPVPAVTSLFIEYESPDFSDYGIQVYNSLGQQVWIGVTTPARFGQSRYTIPVDGWPAGTYYLTLNGADATQSVKFVVLH